MQIFRKQSHLQAGIVDFKDSNDRSICGRIMIRKVMVNCGTEEVVEQRHEVILQLINANRGLWSKRRSYQQCVRLLQADIQSKERRKKTTVRGTQSSPVPVAPELFIEISAVTVVISK